MRVFQSICVWLIMGHVSIRVVYPRPSTPSHSPFTRPLPLMTYTRADVNELTKLMTVVVVASLQAASRRKREEGGGRGRGL